MHRTQLHTESLEQRNLLTITVDTLIDELDGSIHDGDVSLRDAIAAAPLGETIDFAVNGTIELDASLGPLTIGQDLLIDGPGLDSLMIDGQRGTGVFVITEGTVEISDLTISGGGATVAGGGVRTDIAGNTTLSRVRVSDSAALQGGAIANLGAMSIRDSTISGNRGQRGGGINNQGHLTVESSTVSGNTASLYGSAILNNTTQSLLITNSTLSGNYIYNLSNGGFANLTGEAEIRHSTITANNIGLWTGPTTTTTVYSSIVAGNAYFGPTTTDVVSDGDGAFSSLGFNLIGEGNAVDDFAHDDDRRLGNAELGLTPLGNYGGITQTHAVLANSVAVDGGSLAANPSVYDQRGAPYLRTIGIMDIGAVESQTRRVDSVVDESDGDFSYGNLSLREAIELANAEPGRNTILFRTEGPLELSMGELVISDDVTISGNVTVDAKGQSRVFLITDGTVTLSELSLVGGSAEQGGGVYVAGPAVASLINVQVRDNTATMEGGGIFNAGNLVAEETLVADNDAIDGGGIYNSPTGVAHFIRSTVTGNDAIHGAGVANQGEFTLAYSAVHTNSASGQGGGIFNDTHLADPITRIDSSTLSGNTASAGGAVYNAAGQVQVTYSTLTNNDATTLGSGLVTGDTANALTEARSSILAGNIDSNDVVAIGPLDAFVSLGYNLVGDGNAASRFIQMGDQVIGMADPLLDSLRDNGGSSLTHALLPGNLAFDTGDPDVAQPPSTDQRGGSFARVVGTIDIGAYEEQLRFVVDTLEDESDGDFTFGDLSLREALELAAGTQTSNQQAVITFDESLLPATIEITEGQLELHGNVSLVGPGTDQLTLDAGGRSRALASYDGNFQLSGLTITGGNGGNSGGGIANWGVITLADVTLTGNGAGQGGALANFGEATLDKVMIHGNTAASSGAGIMNEGPLTLLRSELTDNSGDALASEDHPVFIEDSRFVNNWRGIQHEGQGPLTVLRSEVDGSYGRGIDSWLSRSVTITQSTISNNAGGGVSIRNARGPITIMDSTISGNSADSGGGLSLELLQGNYPVTIQNSTISGNHAGRGGGIFNTSRRVTMQNSTVTQNYSLKGSGFYSRFFSPELSSSIVAGNTGSDDIVSRVNGTPFTSQGYNLLGSYTWPDPVAAPSDQLLGDASPGLAPLGDNGGPTLTHLPLFGSLAIDGGDPTAVAGVDGTPEHDQRGVGFTRVADGTGTGMPRIDIGAVESQAIVPPNCDFDGDGVCGIEDIDALIAEIAGVGDDLLFDLTLDGQVDLADRDQWLVAAGSLALGRGQAFQVGDANLDGQVDGGDFIIWNANKFTFSGTWSQGDWNADGRTDGQDFVIWNMFKFQESDDPSALRTKWRPAGDWLAERACPLR
ncbi:MAG: right-handed parallel beta-helix repeat-containing protein [Planctomycetota bacterium]